MGVEQKGHPNKNFRNVDDDLRSASERIFGERSNYSEQTVVSESEQLRFLVGLSSFGSYECRLDMDSEMIVRSKNWSSEMLAEKPSHGGSVRLNQLHCATSPSTRSDISTSDIRPRGNSFILARQLQNRTLNKVNQHSPTVPRASNVSKAYGKTKHSAIFAEEVELPVETAVRRSRRMGGLFKIIRTNAITRGNGEDIERESDFEMDSRVNREIGGQGIVAGWSGCFGCVTNGPRNVPGERGTFTGERGTLSSHGSSEIVSQGLRCRKGNVGSSSSGRGSSRRSMRKFSCISSADVLPSVTNPLANGVPNHVFNRQKLGTYSIKHRSGAPGLRIRKSGVCSSGCTVHRNSKSGIGGLPLEQNSPNVNPLPARSQKVSVATVRASKWCFSIKSDDMVSSSNVSCVNSAMQASNAGHSGGGRETSESCRESASLRLEGNSNRGLGLSGRQSGQMEIDRRNTTRTWMNYGVSNNTASFMHDSHNRNSSNFSVRPSTLRTPSVLSPVGMSERMRSVEALSSASSFISSPDVQISNSGFHFSYASTSQSPDMSRGVSSLECHDGHGIRSAEIPVYRPFRQRSHEENQMCFTFDGISRVLPGRDHAERDRISNEPFFMLEANLLFGGISSYDQVSSYDQYRDMRLDVDNMSYEELLALEESIGNVCTGLGKDLISRCLKSKKYTFSLSDAKFIPEESEVKCSVCQEEFEEGVELGVLECGHSHHFLCIEQWLLQKNVCPICKASASS